MLKTKKTNIPLPGQKQTVSQSNEKKEEQWLFFKKRKNETCISLLSCEV